MTEKCHEESPQSSVLVDDPQRRIDDWMKSWDDGTLGSLVDTHPDPCLVEHFDDLTDGRQHLRILVPLCGTCLDMKWFADRGHSVVGVDISEVAARLFFDRNQIPHTVQDLPHTQGKLYQSTDDAIKFYVVNFFDFNETLEGLFDVVWDTGSLGSIDVRDRDRYMTAMSCVLKPNCVFFLETLVFDKTKFEGPPYSFPIEDVEEVFGNMFTVVKVADHGYDVPEDDRDVEEGIHDIGFRFHFYCLTRM
ncbi:thiopurine S-methyltransferase-like [Haliotis rufescens]|uniref:thiopurine S-methyltransferase-like n=1 Tax=Haliotis rufescens TaxID=6454 RepID=UPI00201FA072|nr:thiopurine S-methyltransferase-like [Haliotis rufescens]XP_046365517.2 thiopurine S-methyltransferase-like [Haliotis rufescens]